MIIVPNSCDKYSSELVIEDIKVDKPFKIEEFIKKLIEKYDGIYIIEESFHNNEEGTVNINIYGKNVNDFNIEQMQNELRKFENYTISVKSYKCFFKN